MAKANWDVIPDIREWRGDTRRNRAPYYIGRNMSAGELQFAQSVAQELRARGIACCIELLDT